MSEWKEYTLGELTSLVTKGTTPTSLGYKFADSGINYIKSEAIGYDGRIDRSTFVYIDQETHNKLKRSQLENDDILYSMAGIFLGKNAIVPRDVLPANTNQALAIIRLNKDKAYPKYIHYFLRQESVVDYVDNMSGQSAQPNINFEEIKSIKILIPEIEEQRAIASILSGLDDKIDLLHRQNKTLEQLAETLFRQWFVEEADESWEVGKLGDVIELVYGKGLKEEIRTGDGFPVVGSSGVVGYHNEYLAKGPGVVIGRKGTLGKVIYLYDNFYPIDTTYYVKSKINSLELLYEYFLLRFLKFEDMNSDSAVPGLNRDIALSAEINIPPEKKMNEFNTISSSLFHKIRFNTNQIHTLKQLRDSLLPKLMSGEVRVQY